MDRPILFSAPMVRAILDGRKAQTRRIAKKNVRHPDLGNLYAPGALVLECEPQHVIDRCCPYGQPGDQLWVREAWYCDHWNVQSGPYVEVAGAKELLYYRATDCDGSGATYTGFSGETMSNPWRPSIHMPRWASRISLKVSGIRGERLQDISEADAIAEGIEKTPSGLWSLYGQRCVNGTYSPCASYCALWESINGAGSWDANPWVWVIDFERIDHAA